MTISVDPQVFGSPLVTWVAVFTLAGIVVGLFLILRYGAATGHRREVYSIGLWAILWAIQWAMMMPDLLLASDKTPLPTGRTAATVCIERTINLFLEHLGVDSRRKVESASLNIISKQLRKRNTPEQVEAFNLAVINRMMDDCHARCSLDSAAVT